MKYFRIYTIKKVVSRRSVFWSCLRNIPRARGILSSESSTSDVGIIDARVRYRFILCSAHLPFTASDIKF